MQSTVFYEKLSGILSGLRTTTVEDLIHKILIGPNVGVTQMAKEFSSLIFTARSKLDQLALDPDNKLLIDELQIRMLFDDVKLGQMIAALNTAGSTDGIKNNPEQYRLFFRFFAVLDELRTFRNALEKLVIGPRLAGLGEGEEELVFEIIDITGRGIAFDRLQAILTTIASIHNVIAHALGTTTNLAVAYLDSGSNCLISIKSDGKSIGEFRKLLLEVWDRIRFRKYVDHTKKMEAVAEGLSLIDKINAHVKSGAVDHRNGLTAAPTVESLPEFVA